MCSADLLLSRHRPANDGSSCARVVILVVVTAIIIIIMVCDCDCVCDGCNKEKNSMLGDTAERERFEVMEIRNKLKNTLRYM